MLSLNKRNLSHLLLAIVLAYFACTNFHKLQNNLWNDEIYTLNNFTLVHLKTTLTNYHSTNNHIFYNLVNHFYLKILGINDLKTLLESPWILRLPLLLLALLTLIYAYRLGKLAGGRTAGIIAVLLLATTIPFQNFSMQVRGYAFSVFFDLALIFYLLNYLFTPKPKYLFLIGLLSFLAVYSIPLNLYCIVSIGAFLCVEAIWIKVSTGKTDVKYFYVLAALTSAMILVLLCFIPIMKIVFNNQFVNAVDPFNIQFLHWLVQAVFKAFISERYFLVALSLFGVLIYSTTLLWTSSRSNTIVKALLFQMTIPFAMVFIRGEQPDDRTFIYMVPFFCVLLVIFVMAIIRLIPEALKYPVVLALATYIIAAHFVANRNLNEYMKEVLKNETRVQSLYADYYLSNFDPLGVTHFLKQAGNDTIPVILNDSEPHDMPDYLNAFNIPFHSIDSIDCFLEKKKQVFVITRYPTQTRHLLLHEHCDSVEAVFKPSYLHILKACNE